jgi:hypothetical protein
MFESMHESMSANMPASMQDTLASKRTYLFTRRLMNTIIQHQVFVLLHTTLNMDIRIQFLIHHLTIVYSLNF